MDSRAEFAVESRQDTLQDCVSVNDGHCKPPFAGCIIIFLLFV